MDEQWTKFTAYDMRSALIDDKKEKQNSHMPPATTSNMAHLRTPTSPVPVRSPMHLELASFKKSIKREASAYSTLKDERYFDKFQRDLFITAKSQMFLRYLTLPSLQALHQKNRNYLKPNRSSCIKFSMEPY